MCLSLSLSLSALEFSLEAYFLNPRTLDTCFKIAIAVFCVHVCVCTSTTMIADFHGFVQKNFKSLILSQAKGFQGEMYRM